MSDEVFISSGGGADAGEIARRLLALAEDKGLPVDVVRTVTGGFRVPEELAQSFEGSLALDREREKDAAVPATSPAEQAEPPASGPVEEQQVLQEPLQAPQAADAGGPEASDQGGATAGSTFGNEPFRDTGDASEPTPAQTSADRAEISATGPQESAEDAPEATAEETADEKPAKKPAKATRTSRR